MHGAVVREVALETLCSIVARDSYGIYYHDEAKEKQSLCKNKLIFITGILKLIITFLV